MINHYIRFTERLSVLLGIIAACLLVVAVVIVFVGAIVVIRQERYPKQNL